MMNERLYWWALDRPVLSLFVKDRPILLRPPNYFVVRHPRFCRYWRDPYCLKETSGNPLSDWGKFRQAWKFGSQEIAERVLVEMGETGVIESYPFDD